MGRLARQGAMALGAALVVSVLGWLVLPSDARVPVHLGPDGVDGWAGKVEAVVAAPAAMLVVLVVGLAVTVRQSRRTRPDPVATRSAVDAPGQAATVLVLTSLLWLLVVLHAALLAVGWVRGGSGG